ncbi:hypothetical protein ACIBUY_27560 [Streptomyces sp. NPDC050085]|uniref:hypothetical protein n=1 Tax=Streptomyces sp. NPDC050085 TaxID=3365600 RepID=UPI0037897CB1
MTSKPAVLYVTDPHYAAQGGRTYGAEDVHLTDRLSDNFAITTCTPAQAPELMKRYELVVVRNSGPVIHYRSVYERFCKEAVRAGCLLYNELRGKADMAGKDYLPRLFREGYPVIPTITQHEPLDALPAAAGYVIKPLWGADSIGLRRLTPHGAATADRTGHLLQPHIPFRYEVSFYFVDDTFQYALYAPDSAARWSLQPYQATVADLDFARSFIAWNDIRHGIQRVDACRTKDGRLLLMEIEDLNPYLSLDRVSDSTRDAFIESFRAALDRRLATAPHA